MSADLRRAGLGVRTALTAEYAIDCCKTQPFDAVVIDHHSDDGYSETLLEEGPDVGPAVIVSTAPTPPSSSGPVTSTRCLPSRWSR